MDEVKTFVERSADYAGCELFWKKSKNIKNGTTLKNTYQEKVDQEDVDEQERRNMQ